MKKIFISSEQVGNFNKISRKDDTNDDIKSSKKPGLHPCSENYIFGKTTGG